MGDEFITVARVVRTQGRRGEVAAELHTDFPERFEERGRFYALGEAGKRRELKLESS
ncbi:MAG: 16S rRNA processing protein RimM, partial [Acidobacteriota bacterium]